MSQRNKLKLLHATVFFDQSKANLFLKQKQIENEKLAYGLQYLWRPIYIYISISNIPLVQQGDRLKREDVQKRRRRKQIINLRIKHKIDLIIKAYTQNKIWRLVFKLTLT
jgi:hypothetical protein